MHTDIPRRQAQILLFEILWNMVAQPTIYIADLLLSDKRKWSTKHNWALEWGLRDAPCYKCNTSTSRLWTRVKKPSITKKELVARPCNWCDHVKALLATEEISVTDEAHSWHQFFTFLHLLIVGHINYGYYWFHSFALRFFGVSTWNMHFEVH
jgi:hypothetical protein